MVSMNIKALIYLINSLLVYSYGCLVSTKNSKSTSGLDQSVVKHPINTSENGGFHCGGDPIYLWDDASSANYGTIKDFSTCKHVCSDHVECGGFILSGGICAFWTRTPLNPYKSNDADCYIKSEGGQKYFCGFKHCHFENYKENVDYGYYSKNQSDCRYCQGKCDKDPNCSGVECGGGLWYCSWWALGRCVTSAQKYLNDHIHTTCTKLQYATTDHTSLTADTPPNAYDIFNVTTFRETNTTANITCCKQIRVQSGFQHENKNLESEVFRLRNIYPRVYENIAGDTVTRNGGICGIKEDIGYWMARTSYKITDDELLPTRKWIDLYPTKNKNDTQISPKQYNGTYCGTFHYNICTTESSRKCENLCNKECPETCSEGGFVRIINGNSYDKLWDSKLRISCV